MGVPEHLWRFPTAAAIASLAGRFDLPHHEDMQDWEWQVADASRVDEFLDAYLSDELSDDERFTLMETILQSSEDHPSPLGEQRRWSEVISQLRRHVDLHAYTIYYWACLDADDLEEDNWRVTADLRQIVEDLPAAFR